MDDSCSAVPSIPAVSEPARPVRMDANLVAVEEGTMRDACDGDINKP